MSLFRKKKDANAKILYAAYSILPEQKLIVECYSGQLTIKNIVKYKMKLISDPGYNTSYTMFGDLRDCEIDSLLDDVDQYLAIINQNQSMIMDKGKHVGIFSTANQKIYVQIFKDKFDDAEQNQGMFTKVEDGLTWINKVEHLSLINETFKKLRSEVKAYE